MMGNVSWSGVFGAAAILVAGAAFCCLAWLAQTPAEDADASTGQFDMTVVVANSFPSTTTVATTVPEPR
jgi:hypothetical protein